MGDYEKKGIHNCDNDEIICVDNHVEIAVAGIEISGLLLI